MVTPSWRRVGAQLVLLLIVAACATMEKGTRAHGDREIVSRTRVTGTVNGSVVAGTVSATFNTGGGGRSSCEYAQLPPNFTPGTIGTHG